MLICIQNCKRIHILAVQTAVQTDDAVFSAVYLQQSGDCSSRNGTKHRIVVAVTGIDRSRQFNRLERTVAVQIAKVIRIGLNQRTVVKDRDGLAVLRIAGGFRCRNHNTHRIFIHEIFCREVYIRDRRPDTHDRSKRDVGGHGIPAFAEIQDAVANHISIVAVVFRYNENILHSAVCRHRQLRRRHCSICLAQVIAGLNFNVCRTVFVQNRNPVVAERINLEGIRILITHRYVVETHITGRGSKRIVKIRLLENIEALIRIIVQRGADGNCIAFVSVCKGKLVFTLSLIIIDKTFGQAGPYGNQQLSFNPCGLFGGFGVQTAGRLLIILRRNSADFIKDIVIRNDIRQRLVTVALGRPGVSAVFGNLPLIIEVHIFRQLDIGRDHFPGSILIKELRIDIRCSQGIFLTACHGSNRLAVVITNRNRVVNAVLVNGQPDNLIRASEDITGTNKHFRFRHNFNFRRAILEVKGAVAACVVHRIAGILGSVRVDITRRRNIHREGSHTGSIHRQRFKVLAAEAQCHRTTLDRDIIKDVGVIQCIPYRDIHRHLGALIRHGGRGCHFHTCGILCIAKDHRLDGNAVYRTIEITDIGRIYNRIVAIQVIHRNNRNGLIMRIQQHIVLTVRGTKPFDGIVCCRHAVGQLDRQGDLITDVGLGQSRMRSFLRIRHIPDQNVPSGCRKRAGKNFLAQCRDHAVISAGHAAVDRTVSMRTGSQGTVHHRIGQLQNRLLIDNISFADKGLILIEMNCSANS